MCYGIYPILLCNQYNYNYCQRIKINLKMSFYIYVTMEIFHRISKNLKTYRSKYRSIVLNLRVKISHYYNIILIRDLMNIILFMLYSSNRLISMSFSTIYNYLIFSNYNKYKNMQYSSHISLMLQLLNHIIVVISVCVL